MGITYIKYGVLWIPSNPVIDIIQSWKDLVRTVEPDTIYLNHPVHCTFFLLIADIQDEKHIITKFEHCCNSLSKFSIEFGQWYIFKSDAATGGDTITLAIKPTDALFQSQEKIAFALIPYKKKSVNYPNTWKGVYQEAHEQWGFPFVGKHWLPHISIASVSEKGKEIVAEITNSKSIPKSDFLTNLSLFRIIDQTHEHLITIKLK